MKNSFLVLLLLLAQTVAAQCNLNNATGCVCENSSQTDCDLLPDLTLSWWALQTYDNGPTEFSQTGNGADNGRLRISGSLPNIGKGPLTVRGADSQGKRWFICGTDTISITDPNSVVDFSCPDPAQTARQLILQRVYHKSGNTMSYYDRFAGTMTYHPTHFHQHIDDWTVFTLRLQDTLEPDPRNWPIVGYGAKVGYCLMDFGTCQDYYGHCRTDNTIAGQGAVLSTPADFANYGLGGGVYNCSPVEQGISVGHTDIYGESLDGMWIDIPPGTCNGDYWIVGEVDPNNDFLESDEDNNWTAIPITLTQQSAAGGTASISTQTLPVICGAQPVSLTANAGLAYSWSTGATTRTISVTSPGVYSVAVTNQCGTAVSDPISVTASPLPTPPAVLTPDTACVGFSAALQASAGPNATINWYNAAGQFLASGTSFQTPSLNGNATFLASATDVIKDSAFVGPQDNTIGSGGYFTNANQGLIFDAYSPFTLHSVKIYAQNAGPQTIQLLNTSGAVISSVTANVPAGESRVVLNFSVQPGTGYRLNGNNSGLYRNNSGPSFPYTIPGVISITTSTTGDFFYYFFYDWEISRVVSACESPKVPVTVVAVSSQIVSVTGLAPEYFSNSPASALTGTPAGGVFSGPGISGNIFDPVAAGPGTHTISYTYNVSNCSVSKSVQTVVHNYVGAAEELDFTHAISVSPNPAQTKFAIEINAPQNVELELKLLDMLGRVVQNIAPQKVNGKHEQLFNIHNLSAGMYLLQATINGKTYSQKIIIER